MNKLHLNKSYSLDELEGKNLKNHDLKKLWDVARDGAGGLALEWSKLSSITKNWSEQERYNDSMKVSDISKVTKDFKNDLQTVYTQIFKEY